MTGGIGAVSHLSADQILWVLGTGVVLFAYVATWYNALRLAPATAVTCVLTVGAPITAALNAIAGKGAPGSGDIFAYGLVVMATAVIVAVSFGMRPASPARATVAA
jgi:hypothetical protein